MKKQHRKLIRATEPVASVETIEHPVVEARAVIHCKSSGSPIAAKKTWEVDKPIDFMWMPGGVHTIHASYGRGESDQRPIQLTVHATPDSASAVQSAFDAIRSASPRRPPFICIEHRAQERAGEPVAFEWREDPEPAIYCRCLPSELGAKNVNGKIHTSFSPTFDTDAEYHKMHCTDCEKQPATCKCTDTNHKRALEAGWYFPDGVRGSASNPAKVTAPDVQSVGSLTNWNAFRDMLPIAARENKAAQMVQGLSAVKLVTAEEFQAGLDRITKLWEAATTTATGANNLAVHATQVPQPEPHAETKGQTMKVKFVRAHGTFAVGTESDLDVNHAAILAGDALVPVAADAIMAREAEIATAKAREKASNLEKISGAIVRAVSRGSLLPKGEGETSSETVKAKYVGRFERSECTADICVEQIDALPKVIAADPGRQTTSTGNTTTVAAGETSGGELVRDVIRACEPFQAQLRNGGVIKAARSHAQIVEAVELAREKSRLLAKLDREMQGGFVIRAATLNYVDPAGSNPLGLLNTELMVLNNLGHLENQLAPLRDVTTNIAGQPVAFNQQVRTRYFAIPKVQLKTDATAWSGGTGSNTDVNVKLDTYAGVEIAIGNALLASTPRNIFREQYDPQLYGLGEYILFKLINAINVGNTRIANDDSTTATITFSNTPFSTGGATLKTFVSDLPAALDILKMPGGDEPPGAADLMRFAWVHTRLYAAATGDTNFVLNQSIQSIRGQSGNGNVMETGLFERLGNLKFRKSQMMTDQCAASGTGADGTTNGITVSSGDYGAATNIGFAGTRSSLLFVSRVPEDYTQVLPNIPSTAAVEVVTSPQLGISFLVVKYLDHAYEIAKMRVQLMFGFAIGDERQGVLLTK